MREQRSLAVEADNSQQVAIRDSINGGTIDTMEVNDTGDLAIISYHGTVCELCAPWEQVVISLNGDTSGYPTYDEAEGEGLFHDFCMHTIEAVTIDNDGSLIGALTPEEEIQRVEAIREQRTMERELRKWEKREAAAMNPQFTQLAAMRKQEWEERIELARTGNKPGTLRYNISEKDFNALIEKGIVGPAADDKQAILDVAEGKKPIVVIEPRMFKEIMESIDLKDVTPISSVDSKGRNVIQIDNWVDAQGGITWGIQFIDISSGEYHRGIVFRGRVSQALIDSTIKDVEAVLDRIAAGNDPMADIEYGRLLGYTEPDIAKFMNQQYGYETTLNALQLDKLHIKPLLETFSYTANEAQQFREQVRSAAHQVAASMSPNTLYGEKIDDLVLAAQEGFTNLIRHEDIERVTGTIVRTPTGLEVRFLVPEDLSKFYANREMPMGLAEGGRGISIMNTVADVTSSRTFDGEWELRLRIGIEAPPLPSGYNIGNEQGIRSAMQFGPLGLNIADEESWSGFGANMSVANNNTIAREIIEQQSHWTASPPEYIGKAFAQGEEGPIRPFTQMTPAGRVEADSEGNMLLYREEERLDSLIFVDENEDRRRYGIDSWNAQAGTRGGDYVMFIGEHIAENWSAKIIREEIAGAMDLLEKNPGAGASVKPHLEALRLTLDSVLENRYDYYGLHTGYTFRNAMEGVVKHELGHILFFVNPTPWTELQQSERFKGKNTYEIARDLGKNLSVRSRDSYPEVIAESYARYSSGHTTGIDADILAILRRVTNFGY